MCSHQTKNKKRTDNACNSASVSCFCISHTAFVAGEENKQKCSERSSADADAG